MPAYSQLGEQLLRREEQELKEKERVNQLTILFSMVGWAGQWSAWEQANSTRCLGWSTGRSDYRHRGPEDEPSVAALGGECSPLPIPIDARACRRCSSLMSA